LEEPAPVPDEDPRYRETLAEKAALGTAAALLIVLGVLVGVPLLNWIVGPAFVVTVVLLTAPLFRRIMRGYGE